jgi:hypothetical protein
MRGHFNEGLIGFVHLSRATTSMRGRSGTSCAQFSRGLSGIPKNMTVGSPPELRSCYAL